MDKVEIIIEELKKIRVRYLGLTMPMRTAILNAMEEYANQKQPNFIPDGFVKIIGCDKIEGFEKLIRKEDIAKIAKQIYLDHPGTDGYYNFLKFLWVKYPNKKEERLCEIIPL